MFDNIEKYIKRFNKLTELRRARSIVFVFLSGCTFVFISYYPSKFVIPVNILCCIQIIILEVICLLSDLYLEDIKSNINYNNNETYITNPYNEFVTYNGAIMSIRDTFAEKYIAYLFLVNIISIISIALSAIIIICNTTNSLFSLFIIALLFIIIIQVFYKDGIKVIDNYEKILKFIEDKNNE